MVGVFPPRVRGAALRDGGGNRERAVRLAETLERSVEYGVKLRGFLSDEKESEPGAAPAEIGPGAIYKVRPIGDLPSILRQHVVDEVFLRGYRATVWRASRSSCCCATKRACERASRVDFLPARQ